MRGWDSVGSGSRGQGRRQGSKRLRTMENGWWQARPEAGEQAGWQSRVVHADDVVAPSVGQPRQVHGHEHRHRGPSPRRSSRQQVSDSRHLSRQPKGRAFHQHSGLTALPRPIAWRAAADLDSSRAPVTHCRNQPPHTTSYPPPTRASPAHPAPGRPGPFSTGRCRRTSTPTLFLTFTSTTPARRCVASSPGRVAGLAPWGRDSPGAR